MWSKIAFFIYKYLYNFFWYTAYMNLFKSKGFIILILGWIISGVLIAFYKNTFDMLILEILFAPFTLFVLLFLILLNYNLEIAAPVILVWAFVVTIFKLFQSRKETQNNHSKAIFWSIILFVLIIITLVIFGWVNILSNLT